jgi:Mn2+/Fe2+ NRAMP family transporter
MQKTLQFPYHLKIISISLIPIALALIAFSEDLSQYFQAEKELLSWIFKTIFFLALVLLGFSKEKNESEKLKVVRYRYAVQAILFGIFLIFYHLISEFIYWDGAVELDSEYHIMTAVLIFYLFLFHFRRRDKK